MLSLNPGWLEATAHNLLTLSLQLELESDHQDAHRSLAISCCETLRKSFPLSGLCAMSGWSCRLPRAGWENRAGNNPRLWSCQSSCSSEWVAKQRKSKTPTPQNAGRIHSVLNSREGQEMGTGPYFKHLSNICRAGQPPQEAFFVPGTNYKGRWK